MQTASAVSVFRHGVRIKPLDCYCIHPRNWEASGGSQQAFDLKRNLYRATSQTRARHRCVQPEICTKIKGTPVLRLVEEDVVGFDARL